MSKSSGDGPLGASGVRGAAKSLIQQLSQHAANSKPTPADAEAPAKVLPFVSQCTPFRQMLHLSPNEGVFVVDEQSRATRRNKSPPHTGGTRVRSSTPPRGRPGSNSGSGPNITKINLAEVARTASPTVHDRPWRQAPLDGRYKSPRRMASQSPRVDRDLHPGRASSPAPQKTATGLFFAARQDGVPMPNPSAPSPTMRGQKANVLPSKAAKYHQQAHDAVLGNINAESLGLSSFAAEDAGDWEGKVRDRLTSMNFDLGNLLPSAHPANRTPMDDPMRNGTIIARLIEYIEAHYNHQPCDLVYIAVPATLQQCRTNWKNCLVYLRTMRHNNGTLPQAYLYLDVDDILRGRVGPMWGLLGHLLHLYPQDSRLPVALVSNHTSTYRAPDMAALERAVCRWLHSMRVLHMPEGYEDESIHDGFPPPTEAPYLPSDAPYRHTEPASIGLATVMPYLTNGTVLCDLAAALSGNPIRGVTRNPRILSRCIANIELALAVFGELEANRGMGSAYLKNPTAILQGDRAFILLLIEDVMRCFFRHPSRQGPPSSDQRPFLGNRVAPTHPPSHNYNNASSISATIPERQKYGTTALGDVLNGSVNVEDRARGNSVKVGALNGGRVEGAGGWHTRLDPDAPTDKSSGKPTPQEAKLEVKSTSFLFKLENEANDYHRTHVDRKPDHLTSLSSGAGAPVPIGKSVASLSEPARDTNSNGSDDAAKFFTDKHLSYLESVELAPEETEQLERWFSSKLTNLTVSLSRPSCDIFSDGLTLLTLVDVLEYRKAKIPGIERNPKRKSSCRNNIRRVLDFLKKNKKVLSEYLFLEEALLTGDTRAVVLVLRALRKSYRNHKHT